MALVAKWSLNGNSNDSVGSLNGTDTNISYVSGLVGQGASFNGTSSFIEIPDGSAFANSNMTILSVVKFNAWGDYYFINKDNVTAGREFVIGSSTVAGHGFDVLVFTDDSNYSYNYSDESTRPTIGEYGLIGFSRDSSGIIKIAINGYYVTGTQVATSIGSINNSSSNLFLGSRPFIPSPGFFNGTQEEVQLYDSVLSDSELLSVYNAYFNPTPPTPPPLPSTDYTNMHLFNSALLNTTPIAPTVLDLSDIYLGTQPLANSEYMVTSMPAYDMIAEIESYSLTVEDGGGVINRRYPNKSLTFKLFIQGTSHDDLLAKIDNLKKNTSGTEIDFGIRLASEYRIYTATVQSIRIPNHRIYHDFVDGVEVELLITSPLWRKKEIVEERFDLITNIDMNINNVGTHESYPILYITTKGTHSTTDASIEIKQAGMPTGYTITINQPLVAGDLLVADFKKKTVLKNGVSVNFSGIMRPLKSGACIVGINMTGTKDYNVSAIYSPIFK